MSERSGTASAASSAAHGGDATKRAATIAELVARAHAKLSHAAPLSLTDHLKAAKALLAVRDRLAADEALDAKARMLLLCAGVACYRRWSVGDVDGPSATSATSATTSGAADEAAQLKESEEVKDLVGETMARIFALLCAAERQRQSSTRADERVGVVGVVEAARAAVAAADQCALWSRIAPSRKRPRPEDGGDGGGGGGGGGEDEDAGGEDDEEPSWEDVMRPTTGEIARHALVLGMEALEGAAFEALNDLSQLFFRSAGTDMTEALLMPGGDENVVSLSIARPMAERSDAERAKRLSALAMAAESEAGQSARLLSFEPVFFSRTPHAARPHFFAGHSRPSLVVFVAFLARRRSTDAALDARLEHARRRRLSRARREGARGCVRACASNPQKKWIAQRSPYARA